MNATWTRSLAIASLALGLLAGAANAKDDPWAPGASWVSLRAGFANSSVEGTGDGGMGAGFGFSHMLDTWSGLDHFSLGGILEYNVTGKFGGASEIVVPASLEFARHFGGERSTLRPYLGIGLGAYSRKLYRTGADTRETRFGFAFTTGANTKMSDHGLLGLDLRLISLRAVNDPPNPVFGSGSGDVVPDPRHPTTHTIVEPHNGGIWSIKFTYSVAY